MLKRNLLILISILVLIALGTFYLYQGDTLNTPDATTLGADAPPDEITMLSATPLPDISWQNIEGEAVPESFFNHDFILINFWATWCPPCVIEFPELVEFAANRDNVHLMFVSGDTQLSDIKAFTNDVLPPELRQMLQDNPGIVMIQDADGNITRNRFQTFRLPETYIIDRQKNIIGKVTGPLTSAGYDYIDTLRDEAP